MALFSRVRTQFLSWSQNTPLPVDTPDASPIFQTWHEFDSSTKQWNHVDTTRTDNRQVSANQDSELTVVTWNVDSSATSPESRISAVISHILSLNPAVVIIFFQEVSRAALAFLLEDARIRESWFLSDVDETNWQSQSFASMMHLSKSRFTHTKNREAMRKANLGPIWRVKYPSRFGRDALCCDIHIPSRPVSTQAPATTRIRLVNVHLDSLPIQPSRRPRQISIIASYLRSAERGLVAGDFNPVLPEDETLVQDNGLIDA
jgi:tyrosyl-DNA phosphodiesterase 2